MSAFQPGDELVSVDGVSVAGFSFARVRSAVVGAMGSVVELQVTFHFCIMLPCVVGAASSLTELQLLRSSDGVSRRVFVPRCFAVGASSSGWSSMESERLFATFAFIKPSLAQLMQISRSSFRSDTEVAGTANSFQSTAQAPAFVPIPAPVSPATDQDEDCVSGIGCTFRRDSRGRYRVKRVIKGGAAHSAHAVLSGVCCSCAVMLASL